MIQHCPPKHMSKENHNRKGDIHATVHSSTISQKQDMGKQHKCQSTEEQIEDMVHIYMECDSAIKMQ